MEQNFKFDFVDITIEGDSVYFGDIAELKEGCEQRGFQVPIEKGEYRVLYYPSLFLMANKNLTLGQLRKFFDDMFETEDGYISGENDSFHLPVERLGRLGHCVTAWDETYAICDASIPKNEIQKIEKAPKLSNQPIVSFLSERGAFAIADTEYKYACTGGKEVILSTGYEFPLEEYENVLKSLEDVWVPPLVKPAKKR